MRYVLLDDVSELGASLWLWFDAKFWEAIEFETFWTFGNDCAIEWYYLIFDI